MINILVKQHNFINLIEVSGHADYAQYGSDIVCASVSTAVILSINLIDSFKKIDKIAYEYNEDGYVKIVVKSFDETIEVILNNLLDALKDLELQYPENIKIKQ